MHVSSTCLLLRESTGSYMHGQLASTWYEERMCASDSKKHDNILSATAITIPWCKIYVF